MTAFSGFLQTLDIAISLILFCLTPTASQSVSEIDVNKIGLDVVVVETPVNILKIIPRGNHEVLLFICQSINTIHKMGKKVEDKNDSKFPGSTPPADVRYAQTNITRYCYQMYVDFHRCSRLLGVGYTKCDYFKNSYYSLCPLEWIAKFDQQIKDGTFPVCLPPEPPPKKKK